MATKDKKIAILTANYAEEAELSKLIKTFGSKAVIISADKKELKSMNGPKPGKIFHADFILSDTNNKDYDALILPGGVFNAMHLRTSQEARAWVIDFIESGRLVIASGYSSLLLVSADLVEGRQLTSPIEIKEDIQNAGGEWTNRPTVMDNNLITAKNTNEIKKILTEF